MNMKYSAILFDFDGTLLESGPCIISSLRTALADMGFDELAALGDEALRPMVGPPLREGFLEYLKLPPERVGEAMDTYRAHAADPMALALLKPYGGVVEMLQSLRARGHKLAIVTAKLYEVSELHLKVSGLAGMVDYLSATRTDHGCDKARLIFEAMGALGADPGHTVMVGDRLYDMDAASRAGIPGIGVLYGYGGREELEAHGATQIVQSVERLYSLLTEQEDS